MFLFAAIFCLFILTILGASILAMFSPLLIGIIMIAFSNAIYKWKRQKMISPTWSILTFFVSLLANILFCLDIYYTHIHTGALPFIILGIYGFISILIFRKPSNKKPYPVSKNHRNIPYIIALVCTILAAFGCVVMVTRSSPLEECLPPTILFIIIAFLCWVFPKKKNQKIHPLSYETNKAHHKKADKKSPDS